MFETLWHAYPIKHTCTGLLKLICSLSSTLSWILTRFYLNVLSAFVSTGIFYLKALLPLSLPTDQLISTFKY